jgi:hypothetical protein
MRIGQTNNVVNGADDLLKCYENSLLSINKVATVKDAFYLAAQTAMD